MYPSEFDAAYAGSLTLKTRAPIQSLKEGDSVSVLWDTYGKDYWACYVRASNGTLGWVLCPDLQELRAPGAFAN